MLLIKWDIIILLTQEKEVADDNLLNALENSSFTLKDKIVFYTVLCHFI